VIRRIKEICDQEYHGNIYDNVVQVFSHLNAVEQKVFLKGLINICMIAEDNGMIDQDSFVTRQRQEMKLMEEVKSTVEITKSKVEDSQESLELLNKKQMIMLKTWFIKVLFVLFILLGIGGAIFLMLFDSNFFTVTTVTKPIYEALEVMRNIINIE
jgi:hypothetical protein